ncbi:hypothetical protein V6N13_003317 [Hibiscus sabdariffa]|uniref:Uncharacterized protein n=2 Tax=Hibiscus sabdariffa TaxID=183260 RepID=A0ABR2NAS2_9ROSI
MTPLCCQHVKAEPRSRTNPSATRMLPPPATGDHIPCQLSPDSHPASNLHKSCSKKSGDRHSLTKLKAVITLLHEVLHRD